MWGSPNPGFRGEEIVSLSAPGVGPGFAAMLLPDPLLSLPPGSGQAGKEVAWLGQPKGLPGRATRRLCTSAELGCPLPGLGGFSPGFRAKYANTF